LKIDAGSLEVAHARVWARHGQRPDDALWRRIEATRSLAGVLELAQGSALVRWLEGIGAAADIHAIELAMRRHWRERVDELAAWMPRPWQAAIEWCAVLVDLPTLHHLVRGETPLAWMAEDPLLRGLVDASLPTPPALQRLFDVARADPQRLFPQWRAHWQRCLPREAGRADLESTLVPLLAQHRAAFESPPPVDGWGLRRALQARLAMLLRRTVVEPTTAFIYLALSALEFERLRGELLRRAAFPLHSHST